MTDKFTSGTFATTASKEPFAGGAGQKPFTDLSKPLPTFKAGGVLDDVIEGGVGFLSNVLQAFGNNVIRGIEGDGTLSASMNREVAPGITGAEQRAQAQFFGLDVMDQNTQIALALGAVGIFLLLRK